MFWNNKRLAEKLADVQLELSQLKSDVSQLKTKPETRITVLKNTFDGSKLVILYFKKDFEKVVQNHFEDKYPNRITKVNKVHRYRYMYEDYETKLIVEIFNNRNLERKLEFLIIDNEPTSIVYELSNNISGEKGND